MRRNLSENKGEGSRIEGWHCRQRACTGKGKYVQVQEAICLGCWSGLEVAGGAAGELKGQKMKGHLRGIESALYPTGSEIPLKGFKQEFNTARFGF